MRYRLLVVVLLLLFSVEIGQGAELRLAAAASMSDCVKELAATYQKNKPGVEIILQFASSGNLAKQITHGAPFDLYISANKKWMDHLLKNKQIISESLIYLARNRLVFVASPESAVTELNDLVTLGLIAMGSPRSVPAGQYTAQALKKAGLLGKLDKKKKIVHAKDVRQALRYAEQKEVDGAFVYKTDASSSTKVATKFMVSSDMHDPIIYPAGITLRGSHNGESQLFLDFLKQDDVTQILLKHGFEEY